MHEPVTINCHFSPLNHRTQSTRTEDRHRTAERMCEKVIYKPQPSARGKITVCKASKHNFLIQWGKWSDIIRTCPSAYTNPRKKPATSTNSISSELQLIQLLQHGEFVDLYQINTNAIAQSYSDSLRAGRSGDRIPVGARFSTPVQTGSGPIQPPIRVPDYSRGLSGRGVALTTHNHLAPRLKK